MPSEWDFPALNPCSIGRQHGCRVGHDRRFGPLVLVIPLLDALYCRRRSQVFGNGGSECHSAEPSRSFAAIVPGSIRTSPMAALGASNRSICAACRSSFQLTTSSMMTSRMVRIGIRSRRSDCMR